MRCWLLSLTAMIGYACSAHAGEPGGKVLLDTWDAAYIGEGKAGYVHTIAREIDKDGQKLVHTTLEVRLSVKRFNDPVQMAMSSGSIDTPQGKVAGVFLKLDLGKNQQMQLDGTVKGDQIHFVHNGTTPLKPAPWNADVLGSYKQQIILRDLNLKPGDKHSYLSFEPAINMVFKCGISVRGYREVLLPGNKEKQKLLLVEIVPEKLDSGKGEKVQLPGVLAWLDDKRQTVKQEFDMPGIGPVVLYRTTKAVALAPGPVAQLNDIGLSQLIKLKNRILQPHDTTAAVYRITVRGDDDAATTFSRDDRQQVKNVQGNTFELHVRAGKGAKTPADEKDPGAEFLQSSYFITSDDPKVKEHSRNAVGSETDPWQKVLRIENWVFRNMKVTFDEKLATADHVARTLEGDCTEFSMLTAAMCRAAGIPSRTALGLVYADIKGAPCFAFHMWTEVWIKGRWIPIDATLGQGHVGATHLKIAHHSWHDQRTMTPVLPVIRVMGRVSIDVLSAEN